MALQNQSPLNEQTVAWLLSLDDSELEGRIESAKYDLKKKDLLSLYEAILELKIKLREIDPKVWDCLL